MRRSRTSLAAASVAVCALCVMPVGLAQSGPSQPVPIQPAPAPPIRGFPPQAVQAEHELEEKARSIPQPAHLHTYMARIAAEPHHAGSAGSKAVANYLAAELKEWGLDVRTETFQALLPYPTVRVLEMTAPVRFRPQLKEPALSEDPDTSEPGALPPYNAYSASGDVTAELVYVNYGLPEDYAGLARMGISVRGKIVIARYGSSWRGVKVKLAQEHGAVGCLIYSDPRDDGYFQGDAYPKGPMRPEQGVQRGSVLDMALYPSDPLSPGWASVPGSRRLTHAEAASLPKIPVLPLSWGDARPLLKHLRGPMAPESWRGALPITYRIGPGPATVHLKVDFDWSSRPLYDVIATIPGSASNGPDPRGSLDQGQWILYGNHHDAWVNGATDPASGAAVLLETARTLALLHREGWQPRRTIKLALWDGEEFGLMGSTEWTEKHIADLQRRAAVYLNSDLTGRGVLSAAGSLILNTFLRQVLRDIPEPGGSRRLLETVQPLANKSVAAGTPPEFRLGALGSGSDYVPFVDHAGVASLNLAFGADTGGVYHSRYDTMAWFDRFSDHDLTYGTALAQVMVTSLLRLAGAPVLPFDFEPLARAVRGYLGEIRREARERSGIVNLHGIDVQVAHLEAASQAYNQELTAFLKSDSDHPPASLAAVNHALQHAEQTLLLPDGLPGRPWYRNQIDAPGLYTGYEAKTLPGVREAVEGRRWTEANLQARRVALVLRALTLQVEEATRLLKTSFGS
jgi:N-acetylated-alpha-linked acidic dipeptidase